MAKHEITLYENKGATAESAPFLANYVSKETRFLKELCTAAAKKSGLPEIQLYTIVTGSIDAFAELEKDGPVRITTDLGVICQVINESFPSADAAFDPLVNKLQLSLQVDEAIKTCLANVVPSIVTDATSTKVRLDSVADVAVPRPYNVVHGTNEFQLQGYNLVMSDAGAGVSAENPLGVSFPCTVTEATSKQLVKARLSNAVPGGDYRMVVKSRGGDAEGSLQRQFRWVKVLPSAGPNIRIKALNNDGDLATLTATWRVPGAGESFDSWIDTYDENVGVVEGDVVTYDFTVDGQSYTGNANLENKGNDELLFKIPAAVASHIKVGTLVTFRATLHGGVATEPNPRYFTFRITAVAS